jgi:hypothetical protein
MALSCAIFFGSCSSELELTVAPITIVDDCSHLTLNSVKSIKLQITLVLLVLIRNLMALLIPFF